MAAAVQCEKTARGVPVRNAWQVHCDTDLYRLFGIHRSATHAQIRAAYHLAAKAFHPDLQPGDAARAEAFKTLTNAARILLDQRLRKSYDRGEIDACGNRSAPRDTGRMRGRYAGVFSIFMGVGLLVGASLVSMVLLPSAQSSVRAPVLSAKLAEPHRIGDGTAVYRREALKSYMARDFDGAIAAFDMSLSLEPHDARTLINRGNAWDEKGNADRALQDYGTALRLDPANAAAAHYNRAIVWRRKGAAELAIADLNEAIAGGLSLAQVYRARAEMWSEAQNPGRAVADLERALLASVPSNPAQGKGRDGSGEPWQHLVLPDPN
jgi:tetratricopeptide (TPR) repeat protein